MERLDEQVTEIERLEAHVISQQIHIDLMRALEERELEAVGGGGSFAMFAHAPSGVFQFF